MANNMATGAKEVEYMTVQIIDYSRSTVVLSDNKIKCLTILREI